MISKIVAVLMFVNTGEGLVVEKVNFDDYAACHKWIAQYNTDLPQLQFDRFCMDKKLFDAMNVKHIDISRYK